MELSFRDMQLNRILCYIDFTEMNRTGDGDFQEPEGRRPWKLDFL